MANITSNDFNKAVDFPETLYVYDRTQILDISSTAYIAGTPEVGGYFFGPTSGRVAVTVGGGGRDNTNDNRANISFEIYADNANSTVVEAAGTETQWGTAGVSAAFAFGSKTTYIDGLTSGQKYYARVVYRAETTTSASADIDCRSLIVEPLP